MYGAEASGGSEWPNGAWASGGLLGSLEYSQQLTLEAMYIYIYIKYVSSGKHKSVYSVDKFKMGVAEPRMDRARQSPESCDVTYA